MTGTASAVVLRPMLEYARSTGVDARAIERLLDLTPARLREFDSRIPAALYARAWEETARAAGDPAFGLKAGMASRLDDFDVLGYALHASRTLGEALEQIIRFHRLLCDAWAIAKEDVPAGTRVRRIERTPAPEAEAAFAFLVTAARNLTESPLVPRAVRFAHPRPSSASLHEELFACPVRFGAVETELVFPREALHLPVRSAEPRLLAVLVRYMTKELGYLPGGSSIVEHVRASVARELREGRAPSLGRTARELRASPRTLQRRLHDHGLAFSDVVDAVRKDLSERLLANPDVSITEAAFLTGFADISGFRRRYKKWTGHPPSERPRHGT